MPVPMVAWIVLALIAAPPVIDSVDLNPDHPLYQLETMGENMKLPLGLTTHAALATERAEEYQAMVQQNKQEQFEWLLDQSDMQLKQEQNWERAQEALQARNQILEQTKDQIQNQQKKQELIRMTERNLDQIKASPWRQA